MGSVLIYFYISSMKKLILLLLIVPIVSFGQTQRELELCLALQSRSFSSINEADDALEKVLSVTGLKKNFTLTPCDGIQNALALTVQGERYIFYDKDFLKSISPSRGFSNLAILAHEIGHHLNNHALDFALYYSGVIKPETKSVRRKQELEADEFAGFVMAKLGATLAEAQEPFYSISREGDDTYSTHPSRYKRLRAVEKGYKNAGGKNVKLGSANSNNLSTIDSEMDLNNDGKVDFKDYLLKRKTKRVKSNASKKILSNEPPISISRIVEDINNILCFGCLVEINPKSLRKVYKKISKNYNKQIGFEYALNELTTSFVNKNIYVGQKIEKNTYVIYNENNFGYWRKPFDVKIENYKLLKKNNIIKKFLLKTKQKYRIFNNEYIAGAAIKEFSKGYIEILEVLKESAKIRFEGNVGYISLSTIYNQ